MSGSDQYDAECFDTHFCHNQEKCGTERVKQELFTNLKVMIVEVCLIGAQKPSLREELLEISVTGW